MAGLRALLSHIAALVVVVVLLIIITGEAFLILATLLSCLALLLLSTVLSSVNPLAYSPAHYGRLLFDLDRLLDFSLGGEVGLPARGRRQVFS